jgi:tellurite resistance protein TehA-like permease
MARLVPLGSGLNYGCDHEGCRFAIWRTGGLWFDARDHTATTPVLYLPTAAGSFVSAAACAIFGHADWGQLAFGAGLPARSAAAST